MASEEANGFTRIDVPHAYCLITRPREDVIAIRVKANALDGSKSITFDHYITQQCAISLKGSCREIDERVITVRIRLRKGEEEKVTRYIDVAEVADKETNRLCLARDPQSCCAIVTRRCEVKTKR